MDLTHGPEKGGSEKSNASGLRLFPDIGVTLNQGRLMKGLDEAMKCLVDSSDSIFTVPLAIIREYHLSAAPSKYNFQVRCPEETDGRGECRMSQFTWS